MPLPPLSAAERLAFIDKMGPLAVSEMVRTIPLGKPVLASYKIAQACLESYYGKLPVNGGYFGVKGSGGSFQTREFINGQWVTVTASFQAYGSIEASNIGHSQFLIENGRYTRSGLFKAGIMRDWETCCYCLESAGYATDPEYAELLINIIEDYDLYKFDKEADQVLKELEQLQAAYMEQKSHNATVMNTLEAHIEEINELKKKAVMSAVPDWAKAAADAAVKAGVIDSPKGGSYDFYRLLVIMYRKQLF
jgi:hypothetical protein